MAQENLVKEGVDRVREAVTSIEGDFQRVQKRVEKGFSTRRKSFEKQVRSSRKSFEKQTQKRVTRLRKELNKNAYVQRAQGVVDDATKQFESAVDSVFEVLNVATRRDVSRIDRKLNQINKKLKDLEKASSGTPAARAS